MRIDANRRKAMRLSIIKMIKHAFVDEIKSIEIQQAVSYEMPGWLKKIYPAASLSSRIAFSAVSSNGGASVDYTQQICCARDHVENRNVACGLDVIFGTLSAVLSGDGAA